MILFLANFPNSARSKEGMSQRIVAIDAHFEGYERIYLYLSHKKYCKKQVEQLYTGGLQFRCNIFIHFFFIIKLLKSARLIYAHSLFPVLTALPALFFCHIKKKFVLDAHGVVPEEQKLQGLYFKSTLYELCEKYIFKRLFSLIVVSHKMKEYYLNKHGKQCEHVIVYPILPTNLKNSSISEIESTSSNHINIIYSGNTQLWQNVPEMLNFISKNESSNISYILLTGEENIMKQKLVEHNLSHRKDISIQSLPPHELEKVYTSAHFGFILRDDIIVNNVACPTKMVEYLFYGLTPIIKSANVGDFKQMGCEMVQIETLCIKELTAHKSKKNNKIAEELIKNVNSINLASLLLR